MIWTLVKKQLLLMIRNRSNFTLLLAMPVVLIVIIKFAVGDFMEGESYSLNASVAIAEYSSEEDDVEQVLQEMAMLPIPKEELAEISKSIQQFQPIHLLKEEVFRSEDLKEMIELEEITPAEVETARNEEKYDVIIEIPKNFTYDLLMSNLFEQNKEVPQITLYADQSEQFNSKIIREILFVFENELKTNMVLGKYGLEDLVVDTSQINTEVRSVAKTNPITSTLYYTIGMSVMFVLYIASTIGSYAFEEKRIHVFDRIVLANISKWVYFSGTFLSGAILAFCQLMILFGMALVAFKVTWPNVPQFLVVSLAISLAVGAIASLLTAINYKFNSGSASSVFGTVIVSTLALLGGTFFPISNLSDFMQTLGNLMPNGAALSAYLTTAQGYGFSEISGNIIYLIGFTVVILVVASYIMPKRGQEA